MPFTLPMTMLELPKPPNRRASPRFDTLGRIVGYLLTARLPVRVREISFGGFSVETVTPLPEGVRHRVRFVAADDWSVELDAEAVHCRPSCAADGSPRFATGFAFLAPPQSEPAVERLIATITSVQLFRGPS